MIYSTIDEYNLLDNDLFFVNSSGTLNCQYKDEYYMDGFNYRLAMEDTLSNHNLFSDIPSSSISAFSVSTASSLSNYGSSLDNSFGDLNIPSTEFRDSINPTSSVFENGFLSPSLTGNSEDPLILFSNSKDLPLQNDEKNQKLLIPEYFQEGTQNKSDPDLKNADLVSDTEYEYSNNYNNYVSFERRHSKDSVSSPLSSSSLHLPKKVSDSRLSVQGLTEVLKLNSTEEALRRERFILNIFENKLHYPLGYKTWVRDTPKNERSRLLSLLYEQVKLKYPEYDKCVLEVIIKRATYYMMQSRLRRERRAKAKIRKEYEKGKHYKS